MKALGNLEAAVARPLPALVAGWFSFDAAEVTAGDLLARDTVARWLADAGVPADIAVSAGFRRPGEVALDAIDPRVYGSLIFVCGPAAGGPVERLFARFNHCPRIAVDVSVVEGTARLTPVRVIARDSPAEANPDLSLWAQTTPTPVVGVIRAHAQPEYGTQQRHAVAHAALDRLLVGSDVAVIGLDTRLDPKSPGHCRTPDQLVSAIARVDATVTTRLHGLALSLKAGVPVLAIDPIAGGGKVVRQARALGWPAVQTADALDHDRLAAQLRWCLSDEARRCAGEVLLRTDGREPVLRGRLLAAVGASCREPAASEGLAVS